MVMRGGSGRDHDVRSAFNGSHVGREHDAHRERERAPHWRVDSEGADVRVDPRAERTRLPIGHALRGNPRDLTHSPAAGQDDTRDL